MGEFYELKNLDVLVGQGELGEIRQIGQKIVQKIGHKIGQNIREKIGQKNKPKNWAKN